MVDKEEIEKMGDIELRERVAAGLRAIKSDKLRQWVKRKNIKDKPKYLEGVK